MGAEKELRPDPKSVRFLLDFIDGRYPKAKSVGENELLMRKHIQGQADYCELKIKLSPTGAKIEQSTDCGHFAAGICHFSSDGKELVKIK
jgi:hypothetical protein